MRRLSYVVDDLRTTGPSVLAVLARLAFLLVTAPLWMPMRAVRRRWQ